MLPIILSAFLLQSPAPVQATQAPWAAAAPALAAKAPGSPTCGLVLTTEAGRFLLTHFGWSVPGRHQVLKGSRILGPAGLGPYRYGFWLGVHPEDTTTKRELPHFFYENYFYPLYYPARPEEAPSPGLAAGLDGRWGSILQIDGQTLAWDAHTADYYISTHPTVAFQAAKFPLLFGDASYKTFKLSGRKADSPPDPADGTLQPGLHPAAIAILNASGNRIMEALAANRNAAPPCAPLDLSLPDGHRLRIIRNPWAMADGDSSQGFPACEFWDADQAKAPFLVVKEPILGLLLNIHDQWYRVESVTLDPATQRLAGLKLQPWRPDIQALLGGSTLQNKNRTTPVQTLEPLEELCNDALIEWKTRTLPTLLETQDRTPSQDLVIRIEKGILTLDLATKGIRSRLDAAARAEAERKAQVELATKEGRTAPAPAPPMPESERLADLLEQRKAILMAILGNAKQALANLRR